MSSKRDRDIQEDVAAAMVAKCEAEYQAELAGQQKRQKQCSDDHKHCVAVHDLEYALAVA